MPERAVNFCPKEENLLLGITVDCLFVCLFVIHCYCIPYGDGLRQWLGNLCKMAREAAMNLCIMACVLYAICFQTLKSKQGDWLPHCFACVTVVWWRHVFWWHNGAGGDLVY